MGYIPHTEEDRKTMLATIGVSHLEDLFRDIPKEALLREPLNLPPALDEHAIIRELTRISRLNKPAGEMISFLGAGVYQHFIPSLVYEIISRGEFLTAYTPYQPEMSQGYLQTIYEFQSLICELTQMDVANASMYDGGTASAEAVLMASQITNRHKAIVCESVHPHYRHCIHTFAESPGIQVQEDTWEELGSLLTEEVACLVIQYPDFFGRVKSPASLIRRAREVGALSIVISNPIALGVLNPPGFYGADIVVGEAQPLGVPMGFGGPMVGYFCSRKEHIRYIPGRIVGATVDTQGRRGFVMTLRTREQDIKRERATSNICTNQALMALAATVYLCALGKKGIRAVAETCIQKAHYTAERLCSIPGVSLVFPEDAFAYEFAVKTPIDASRLQERLLEQGFLAGLPLSRYFPDMHQALLLAVTEVRTREEIDSFISAVAKAVN
jgi:glycine dehydrogenase subunit 1